MLVLDYFGTRFYDSDIARFLTVDRLADKFPRLTRYQYASNNPILNLDLEGLEKIFFQNVDPIISGAFINLLTSTPTGAQIINNFTNPNKNIGYDAVFIPEKNLPSGIGRFSLGYLQKIIGIDDFVADPTTNEFSTPQKLFNQIDELQKATGHEEEVLKIQNALKNEYGV